MPMKHLLLICLMFFSGMEEFSGNTSEYDKLWKEVESLEKKRLSQSAYELVEKIWAKALRESVADQQLKCLIYKAKLSTDFKDRDPADYITDFEESINDLELPLTRAVMHSLLGEMYHNYGISNVYRFSQRTALEEESDSSAFNSLEAIQEKAMYHFNSSLDLGISGEINQLNAILLEYKSELLKINAENLQEFLLFRAIEHFSNSSAFVSHSKSVLALNDPALFEYTPVFLELDFNSYAHSDYRAQLMRLFQSAESAKFISSKNKSLIYLYRIQYVSRNYESETASELYRSKLEECIRNDYSEDASALAHVQLIEYYLEKAFAQSHTKSDINYFQEAFRWISKFQRKHGKSEYGKIVEQQKSRLNEYSLNLSLEQVQKASSEFLCHLHYRNTPKVYFRLYKLSLDEIEKINTSGRRENKLGFLDKKKIMRQWSYSLPAHEDLDFHGIELPINALNYGSYVLLASADDEFSLKQDEPLAMQLFHVSDMAYYTSPDGNGIKGYVVDRNTGKPLSGVQVDLMEMDYHDGHRKYEWSSSAKCTSDKNGHFSFDRHSNNFSLRFICGKDSLDLRKAEYNYQQGKSYRQKRLSFFTDRGIYRPGQRVYFKALVYESDSKDLVPALIKSQEVQIELKDANGQLVDKVELVSNDYGTMTSDFLIPQSVLTGSFTLEARFGDNYASHNIQVEAYKRPRIKAEFESNTDSYGPGDSIDISGLVSSYSGLLLENAKIEYRVYRSIFYWPFDYRRIMPPFNRNRDRIASGQVQSDASGRFVIRFASLPEKENANYEIECDITDATGESLSISKTISVYSSSFGLDIQLPEKAFRSEIGMTEIKALNPEGELQDIELDIEIFRLETPTEFKRSKFWGFTDQKFLDSLQYEKRFPLDSYSGENEIEDWPVAERLRMHSLKGKHIITDAFGKLSPGAYKIAFKARNTKGDTIIQHRYLSLAEAGKMASGAHGLWISALEGFKSPGETLTIQSASAIKNYRVFYRIQHNGNTLKEGFLNEKSPELEFVVEESHRGGLHIDFIMVRHGRYYQETRDIHIPWTNKSLDIKVVSISDTILPGSDQTVGIEIKDEKGNGVQAELAVVLYDASLDALYPHKWNEVFYPQYYRRYHMRAFGFDAADQILYNYSRPNYYSTAILGLQPQLNWFGLSPFNYYHHRRSGVMEPMAMTTAAMKTRDSAEEESADLSEVADQETLEKPSENNIRENLDELVFFYPSLRSDADGKLNFNYRMNDALASWKMMFMAHTADLEYAFHELQLKSRKSLMLEAFVPRFVRQGDVIQLTGRLSNTSDKLLEIKAHLSVRDANDGQELTGRMCGNGYTFINVILEPGKSRVLEWELSIPADQLSALEIVMHAESGLFSDAELNTIPVLSNNIFVTESLPIFAQSGKKQKFKFGKLKDSEYASSLRTTNLSLSYNSNTQLEILKALPYMLDENGESTTQIFESWYASRVGKILLENNSDLEKIVRLWADNHEEGALSKNETYKSLPIEETPWLRNAMREDANIRNLALLTDENKFNYSLKNLLNKLEERQLGNGGFSWMPGGRDNWYISQYVLEGIVRMNDMGIDWQSDISNSGIDFVKAVNYLDDRFYEYYEDQKTLENRVSALIIHYLYVRQHFSNVPMKDHHSKAMQEYMAMLPAIWKDQGTYLQALIGMILLQSGDLETVEDIRKSLDERMIKTERTGYYWNDQAGYYWYELNVEKQATLIDFYRKTDAPYELIDGMRLWLLANKQVNSWESSKATASAVYSFFDSNSNRNAENSGAIIIEFPDAGLQFDLASKQHAGLLEVDLDDKASPEDLAELNIDNQTESYSWGALYWQYFEKLDKVKSSENHGLAIEKDVFKLIEDKLVPVKHGMSIEPGDRIKVRMKISTDRPMEFMLLKDLRPSGTETVNVISRYKWQDGLSYYETSTDVGNRFYIDFLPKGSFVFEYELRVTHRGRFVNGLATIESMYAPQFRSMDGGEILESN